MAMNDDPEMWKEQQRFYNFLQHYELHKYHQKFLAAGVSRISHLKSLDDKDLEEVGLSRPERNRLFKKLDENFSLPGLIKKSVTGKRHKFDGPAPEVAHKQNGEPGTHHTASLIAKEEVKLGRKIGEGAHGSVHEGTWANVHGSDVFQPNTKLHQLHWGDQKMGTVISRTEYSQVAGFIQKVSVAVKTLYGKREVQSQFITEADSMRSLNHPHIIRLYGIVLSSPLMLIEELAPFGNLQQHLIKNGKHLNVQLFHTYACQIADAMKYLEERRIVHRDLAARNILLSQEDYIKLSDFGMARILDENSDVYNLSNLQSRIPVAWTALEALSRAKFSAASDVWSYGVTLWEIYSLGKIPWQGLSPIEIRDALAQGERLGRPERCPADMYRVMQSCWETSAHDRPSFVMLYHRIVETYPKRVRAIKPHKVMADEDSLSFGTGDTIFVIDKPKIDWMFGMKMSGEIGLFEADHVSSALDPVGDLKEKVQSGKAKAANLPISHPTFVNHDYHWGYDGKKWGSEATRQQGQVIRNSAIAVGSSRESSLSPPMFSPRLNQDFGTSGYSRNTASASGSQSSIESDVAGFHISEPPRDMSRQMSKGDQYVTIVGAGLLEDEMPPVQEEVEDDNDSCDDDGYDYLRMEPGVSVLQQLHQYQNVPANSEVPHPLIGQQREEVPAYATSEARDRIKSSDSSVCNTPNLLNREHSLLEDEFGSTAPMLPTPLVPMPAASHPSGHSTQGTSQFSFPLVAQTDITSATFTGTTPDAEGMTPTSVQSARYVSCNQSPAGTVQQNETGIARPRPKPRNRLMSQKDINQNGSDMSWRCKSFSIDENSTPQGRANRTPPEIIRRASAGSPGRLLHRSHVYETVAAPPPDCSVRQPGTEVEEGEPRPKLFSPDSDQHPLINTQSAPKIPVGKNSSEGSETDRDLGPSPVPHYESVLMAEFPDASQDMCRRALEKHKYDPKKAKEEVMIQLLMGMQIPCVDYNDCKRALSHCQWKMDRAAAWLLDQSDTILSRVL